VAEGEGEGEGEVEGEGEGEEPVPTVTVVSDRPVNVVSFAEVGASINGFGDRPGSTGLGVRGTIAYPLTFGSGGVDAGMTFTYAPVPYEDVASGTASLTSLLASASVNFPIIPKLRGRGEVGLGGLFFGGLQEGNPYTQGNMELGGAPTSGALGMFNARFGIGADYAVGGGLIITATPFAFSYSPPKKGLHEDLSAITQIQMLVGVGYQR
jgi:hypothetical protein